MFEAADEMTVVSSSHQAECVHFNLLTYDPRGGMAAALGRECLEEEVLKFYGIVPSYRGIYAVSTYTAAAGQDDDGEILTEYILEIVCPSGSLERRSCVLRGNNPQWSVQL